MTTRDINTDVASSALRNLDTNDFADVRATRNDADGATTGGPRLRPRGTRCSIPPHPASSGQPLASISPGDHGVCVRPVEITYQHPRTPDDESWPSGSAFVDTASAGGALAGVSGASASSSQSQATPVSSDQAFRM